MFTSQNVKSANYQNGIWPLLGCNLIKMARFGTLSQIEQKWQTEPNLSAGEIGIAAAISFGPVSY